MKSGNSFVKYISPQSIGNQVSWGGGFLSFSKKIQKTKTTGRILRLRFRNGPSEVEIWSAQLMYPSQQTNPISINRPASEQFHPTNDLVLFHQRRKTFVISIWLHYNLWSWNDSWFGLECGLLEQLKRVGGLMVLNKHPSSPSATLSLLSQHRNPLNIVICSFSCHHCFLLHLPPTTTSNTHRPQKRWIRWTNSTDLWKGGAITVHPLLYPEIIAKTNCLSSFYSHMATDRGSSCPREIKLFNRVTWFIHRWGANVPWSYPCTTASDDDDDDQSMG